MIDKKYYKTINRIYENANEYVWEEVPNEWVRQLELPDYAPGDLNECYYFKPENKSMGIAIGSYYSRFYYDIDEYSTSKEYFITFFIEKKNKEIKGVNLITADDYFEYKRKNDSAGLSSLLGVVEEDVIKAIYEIARSTTYDMDTLLDDFLDDEEE